MGRVALAAALLLSGCTSVAQKLDPAVVYKRDMRISVNGFVGDGVLVVPRAPTYEFNIEAKGKLDLFTLTTCHRDSSREDGWDHGFLASTRKASLIYIPVTGIEDEGSCVVDLGGYERDKGRHSWGLVDFEGPDATLPAHVKCNGSEWNSRGVTICQSRAGLLEEVAFETPVDVIPDAACPMPVTDGKQFRFPIAKGKCAYAFMEKGGAGRVHRLTTLGYENILIRED